MALSKEGARRRNQCITKAAMLAAFTNKLQKKRGWIMALTNLQAHEIYTILREECGASDTKDNRLGFVNTVLQQSNFPTEYRINGSLGFGGKFRMRHDKWYVDCYPEDRTPECDEMIERANKRLADLKDTA